jgi:hypothetical protein
MAAESSEDVLSLLWMPAPGDGARCPVVCSRTPGDQAAYVRKLTKELRAPKNWFNREKRERLRKEIDSYASCCANMTTQAATLVQSAGVTNLSSLRKDAVLQSSAKAHMPSVEVGNGFCGYHSMDAALVELAMDGVALLPDMDSNTSAMAAAAAATAAAAAAAAAAEVKTAAKKSAHDPSPATAADRTTATASAAEGRIDGCGSLEVGWMTAPIKSGNDITGWSSIDSQGAAALPIDDMAKQLADAAAAAGPPGEDPQQLEAAFREVLQAVQARGVRAASAVNAHPMDRAWFQALLNKPRQLSGGKAAFGIHYEGHWRCGGPAAPGDEGCRAQGHGGHSCVDTLVFDVVRRHHHMSTAASLIHPWPAATAAAAHS